LRLATLPLTGLHLDLLLSEVKDLLCATPTATLDLLITMKEFYHPSAKTDLSARAVFAFLVELA
jgi:hypothetical protein